MFDTVIIDEEEKLRTIKEICMGTEGRRNNNLGIKLKL
jgi:hypothetical protein